MMSRFVGMCLLFVTALFSLEQSAWAQVSVSDQVEYLKAMKKVVKFYEVANHANLLAYRACACRVLAEQGKSSPTCANQTTQERTIIRHIDIFSEEQNFSRDCRYIVEHSILAPIEKDYARMQIAAALASPEMNDHPSVDLSVKNRDLETVICSSGKEPGCVKERLLFSDHPRHSVKLKSAGSSLQLQPMHALSPAEVVELRRLYQQNLNENCSAFVVKFKNDLKGNLRSLPSDFYNRPCKYLLNNSLMSENLPKPQISDLKIVQDKYVLWASQFRAAYRDSNKQLYSEIINHNPLLLLVENSNPHLERVIGALDILISNSLWRLKESLKIFSRDETLEGLRQYLEFPYADYWAQDRLSEAGWSSDRLKRTREVFDKYLRDQELSRMYTSIGASVASILVCVIPLPQKVFAIPFAVLLKNICFTALSTLEVGVTTYLDMSRYHNNLQKFFSTPDGITFLKKFESIESAPTAIETAAYLILPFAMDMKSARFLEHMKKYKF